MVIFLPLKESNLKLVVVVVRLAVVKKQGLPTVGLRNGRMVLTFL
jgi:hypothetical protein